jgi:hypothetical protein
MTKGAVMTKGAPVMAKGGGHDELGRAVGWPQGGQDGGAGRLAGPWSDHNNGRELCQAQAGLMGRKASTAGRVPTSV